MAITQQYGMELYAGKHRCNGKLIVSKVATEDAIKTSLSFNAILYPNPVVSNAMLQITGNTKNVSVSITDMNGKKLWQTIISMQCLLNCLLKNILRVHIS